MMPPSHSSPENTKGLDFDFSKIPLLAKSINALRGDFLVREALTALAQSQPEKALIPLLVAKETLHDRDELDALLGKTLVDLKRADLARDYLERALVRHPNSEALWSVYRALPRSHEHTQDWSAHKTNDQLGFINHLPQIDALQKADDPVAAPATGKTIDAAVVVLVPVYEGIRETLECINSVLRSHAHNRTAHRVVVIDDASSNTTLVAVLQALAREGKIGYHRNERNQGFVKTMNVGMASFSDSDVVWLNADTRVHGNWLDRLHAAAYRDPKIASVTPLSNNGELMSYPTIQVPSPMPSREDLAKIDTLAGLINPEPTPIPMGCGFCFFVKRAALKDVGLLDEESFSRGYGEETDWCLRASRRGWLHVGAANVFVAHQGGVSFGAEKALRVQANNMRIARRYPNAHQETERFRAADPLRAIKKALQEAVRVHQVSRTLPGLLTHLKNHPIFSAAQWIEEERRAYEQNIVRHCMIADPIDNPSLGKAWLQLAKRWQRAGLPPLLLLATTPWERELTRTGAVLRLPHIPTISRAEIVKLCGCRYALTMAPDPQPALSQLIELNLAHLPVRRLSSTTLHEGPKA